jgi:translation initiation factor eIF-2B subunit delta
VERIDQYIHERITMAIEVLAQNGMSKIKDGDVILTYGFSSTVLHLLKKANKGREGGQRPRKFHVIVVDSRPKLEGKKMCADLLSNGISTTYVLINSLGYVVKKASKVILGAQGLLGNGALIARCGSAQVALMAQHQNLPVIVACETYKFSQSIHLDSVVFNELVNPEEVVNIHSSEPAFCTSTAFGTQLPKNMSQERSLPSLKVLGLLFDVTPPEFITVVITELGLVPGSSVPVVLREYKPLLEAY